MVSNVCKNRIAGCSERKISQRRQKLCHILNSESERTLFSYFLILRVNGKALLTWNMPTLNVTKMVAQRRISGNQVIVGFFLSCILFSSLLLFASFSNPDRILFWIKTYTAGQS